jgi:hypothetical protein
MPTSPVLFLEEAQELQKTADLFVLFDFGQKITKPMKMADFTAE